MFDTDQLLADLAALDPLDAYHAAAGLHWRIRDLAATKGIRVLQSILPTVTDLSVDMDHEYDDAGGTFRVFNSVTLTLQDGRTLELPDEGRVDDESWADGCCAPSLDADAQQRVDARIDADPDLDLADAMLAELGTPFGLDLDAMRLLVDVASFLAREGASEGGMTFQPPAGNDSTDAECDATTPSPAIAEVVA